MVNHPVRRRVIMALMLLGSGGIVTAVVTVVFSFAGAQGQQKVVRALVLVTGPLVLLVLARSRWVDRWLTLVISRFLGRFTDLDVRDYSSLLHLAGEYAVMELAIEAGDWVAGRSLTELELRDEGLVVLGIVRPDGVYVGVPTGSTVVHAGDTLILYGREPDLCELDQRRAGAAGDRARVEAVAEQDQLEQEARRLEAPEPV